MTVSRSMTDYVVGMAETRSARVENLGNGAGNCYDASHQ